MEPKRSGKTNLLPSLPFALLFLGLIVWFASRTPEPDVVAHVGDEVYFGKKGYATDAGTTIQSLFAQAVKRICSSRGDGGPTLESIRKIRTPTKVRVLRLGRESGVNFAKVLILEGPYSQEKLWVPAYYLWDGKDVAAMDKRSHQAKRSHHHVDVVAWEIVKQRRRR